MAYIYHLVSPKLWEKALDAGYYKPTAFEEEGFIHFSTKEQVIPSASKHYKENQHLVILAVSEKRVKQYLKWEESRNNELFPHLYCKLALAWVETSYILARNDTGEWVWD